MLPKVSAHVKSYDGQTKWIQFLIENDDLLEKYNTVSDKVSTDIKKKKIGSEFVYNKTFFENHNKTPQ